MSTPAPRQSERATFFAIVTALVAGGAVWSGVVHRIVGRWQPQGDDADIAWLSHDVFTRRIPLLGMPSTIGGRGSSAHHWGPLLFWILAVPQKLMSEHPVGLLVGVVVIGAGALVAIAVFTARQTGRAGALLMMVLVSLVALSLGRDVLSSIWNPNIAVLPLVAVFVTAWSFAAGDRVALPFLVFFASFVVQANVLYTPVVGVVVLWAVVGGIATARSLRRDRDVRGAPDRRSRSWWVSAAVVGVLAWSGPVLYEVWHQPGNVSALLKNGTGEPGEHVGLARAVNVIVRGFGVLPVWLRRLGSGGSLGRVAERAGGIENATAALLCLGLVVALVCSRRDAAMRSLLGTAIAGVIGAVIGIARLPWTFGIPIYRVWTLWIVGIFVWFALIVLVGRMIARAGPFARWSQTSRISVATSTVLVVVLVVVAVLGVVGRSPRLTRDRDDSALVRTLVDQARRRLDPGTPYIAVQAAPFVGAGVLWGLERHGFDVRITDAAPFESVYLGQHQVRSDEHPRRLYVLAGDAPARTLGPGHVIARAVVTHNEAGVESVRAAARRACLVVSTDPPLVSRTGRRRIETAARDSTSDALAAFARTGDGCELVRRGALVDLVDNGDLTVDLAAAAEVVKLRVARTAHRTEHYEIRVAP